VLSSKRVYPHHHELRRRAELGPYSEFKYAENHRKELNSEYKFFIETWETRMTEFGSNEGVHLFERVGIYHHNE
jgi:hypothetical protein